MLPKRLGETVVIGSSWDAPYHAIKDANEDTKVKNKNSIFKKIENYYDEIHNPSKTKKFDWFSAMSKQAQKGYIKLHPTSKYAKKK